MPVLPVQISDVYRQKTYEAVWAVIDQMALPEPKRLSRSMLDTFRRMWNTLIVSLGSIVPQSWRDTVYSCASVPDFIKRTLQQLGMSGPEMVKFMNEEE